MLIWNRKTTTTAKRKEKKKQRRKKKDRFAANQCPKTIKAIFVTLRFGQVYLQVNI